MTSDHITITGSTPAAASAFDVDGLLVDTASSAIGAVDSFAAWRGIARPERTLDRQHLLAYCTTSVSVDGDAVPAWADLSGVYETAGGRHLQVHCNFEHHAAGVVARLGCSADRESVAAAMKQRDAFELEAELIADGMIGAVVRSLDEWDRHPHAAATKDLPLTSVERLNDADARMQSGSSDARSPLAGVRVVDCSRVLAGPVAGSMLADFGADVMRVGADHLPSVPICVLATGFGKRNTALDLRTPEGRASMDEMLSEADVLIDAYRPGALESHGYSPARIAALRPGIVIVQVCAFDWVGLWAGRRGFDSIVQTTTGVRAAGGAAAIGGDGSPVGLPVQALDYATGFVAVGFAASLLERQRTEGGSWLGRTSLLRCRNELVRRGGPTPFTPSPVTVPSELLDEVEAVVDGESHRVRSVRPFVGEWRGAPLPLGSASPTWD